MAETIKMHWFHVFSKKNLNGFWLSCSSDFGQGAPENQSKMDVSIALGDQRTAKINRQTVALNWLGGRGPVNKSKNDVVFLINSWPTGLENQSRTKRKLLFFRQRDRRRYCSGSQVYMSFGCRSCRERWSHPGPSPGPLERRLFLFFFKFLAFLEAKLEPRCSRIAPKRFQNGPRGLQDASRGLQDPPRSIFTHRTSKSTEKTNVFFVSRLSYKNILAPERFPKTVY